MDSIGQELERLAGLLEAGHLSQEEYQLLKARLLGSSFEDERGLTDLEEPDAEDGSGSDRTEFEEAARKYLAKGLIVESSDGRSLLCPAEMDEAAMAYWMARGKVVTLDADGNLVKAESGWTADSLGEEGIDSEVQEKGTRDSETGGGDLGGRPSEVKNESWVHFSADGETMAKPEGSEKSSDEIAVEVLRGRYRREETGAFWVPGPAIDDGCLLNRMRRYAVENYGSLPTMPSQLKHLIALANESSPLAYLALADLAFAPLRKVDRKFRKLQLTPQGEALLSALVVMGCIMREPDAFCPAFSNQPDMLREEAAGFAAALFPAIKSFPNRHQENLEETKYALQQMPELKKWGPERTGTALDKPFFSPIDQIMVIANGIASSQLDEHERFMLTRRVTAFYETGISLSKLSPSAQSSLECTVLLFAAAQLPLGEALRLSEHLVSGLKATGAI